MSAALSWLLAAAVAAPGAGDTRTADAVRSSWKYRRDVPPGSADALAAVALPLDVQRKSQPGLQDLRLVAADGTEVPYIVESVRVAGSAPRPTAAGLVDRRVEKRQASVWVVDLGEVHPFDRIDFDIAQTDFAKRASLEVSDDQRSWRTLKSDAGLFDAEWGGRVHHTFVELPAPVRGRWLRLIVDDRRSAPIEVQGARVTAPREWSSAAWREPFTATLLTTVDGVSRYRLEIPAGTPAETLEIAADDPAFARTFTLYDVRTANGRTEEVQVGQKRLYHLRLPAADGALAVDDAALPAPGAAAGYFVVAVRDGDSPPLKGLRGTAVGTAARLIFPRPAGSLALYYGNTVTRAPLYDLNALRSRLAAATGLAPAELAAESANPAFVRPPPLPIVGTHGAAVEASRWRWSRSLDLTGEDLFTALLAPEDVAAARADFGDLRVVDGEGRQVPYILASGAGEAWVDFVFEPEGESSPRRRVLRLALPEARALPVHALEIDVADRFFSRPIRVSVPPSGGRRDRETVASTVLSRVAEAAAGSAAASPRIGLDGARRAEWRLEIEEGDNAPLAIRKIRGAIQVPRVVFKATPGRYRLLVGNRDATAPQYDLESLRHEVLAYSAVAAEPGPLQPNERFRRSAGDYLKTPPATLVLWGTLLVAVVGLLALTARILRAPSS